MRNLRSPFKPRFTPTDAEVLASVLAALASPARLRILALLHEFRTMTVVDLTEALDTWKQPTITHHLGVLEAAGLVWTRHDGAYRPKTMHRSVMADLAKLLNPGEPS